MNMVRRVGERLGSTGRVVTAIVVLIVVAFAVSGYVAERTLERQLVDRVDGDILDEARTAREIVDGLPDAELGSLRDRQRPPSNTAIIVLDADGNRLYSGRAQSRSVAQPLPAVPPLNDLRARSGVPFDVHSASGDLEYRAVAVTITNGAVILVAGPLDTVEQTVDTLRERLLVVWAIALAVLALLVWAVVANANRQLNDLVDTATRIGEGDLSARVDVPTSTRNGRLGHALNDMVHQLEMAFAAREASEDRLRRFAADASHELRTPLTHIRGYAELLRSGAATSADDQARAINRIEAEACRMSDLVDDLLLLARLDQQRPLDTAAVDLNVVVFDSVTDARAAEPDRPITFSLPDSPLVVPGDEGQLRQTLANLLGNIRVHTPPGTPAKVTLTALPDAAIIRVDDEGPGMSDRAAARAFDRFYRPEDSRSRANGGSGLGLAIAEAVVHAHGGTITLDTAPGAGTHVTITVPTLSSER
jgi:two-component system OmpR family sensor kinase